ncbi:hypothetical protein PR202_ga20039 [Eleusine coracana subsp. coracana]|uniref:CCHC-type domain-containing protein n=1 Tax=Eleusine coracana subsp. coracana TaxID=191504 RepID=A0AAV5CY21_ELECO|nr:hypothetical protein PR202_ga20039 [Eleusine coracana subsp. coracana]
MAASAPTGCYKCGRPGHWSRDCPSAPASADPGDANPKPAASRFAPYPNARPRPAGAAAAAAEGDGSGTAQKTKKKKERATRPKLTPDLLLSDDGIGFVLRHFPKAFKPRGRPGREVDDLGDLIKLYADWHSHLIPYYSFDQFVRKVEKIGASNRVRKCISKLRDRVAHGGDPTKLHEPPVEEVPTDADAAAAPEDADIGTEAPLSDNHVDSMPQDIHPTVENYDMDTMQEDLLNDIYEKNRSCPRVLGSKRSELEQRSTERTVQKPHDGGGNVSTSTSTNRAKIELTEEQKARMEANRLKALERAAARARSSQPT